MQSEPDSIGTHSGSGLYDIPIRRANGDAATLREHQGKVLLIVNVASKCGLTPQYDGLQKLYAKYRDQGLMIAGFPANEFLSQEPGSNEEIQQFCRLNYGVEFPVYAKIVVKGQGQHPLYAHLTHAQPEAVKAGGFLSALKSKLRPHSPQPEDISWNFEKFLADREGRVIARFAPDVKPENPMLVEAIEAELAKPVAAVAG
jgi:glutathione peroxidase